MSAASSIAGWEYPEDTVALCQHVAEHGPDQWHRQKTIECSPQLLALKWHALQLARIGSIAKASKAYSEWELCVMFLACHAPSQSSRKALLADLASWLPGRSAEGLRQAYAHNVAGSETKVINMLAANGWPTDLTALLEAWPGPSEKAQAVLDADGIEGHKAAAAELLKVLPKLTPQVKKRKAESPPPPAAAAAAAAAAGGGSLAGPSDVAGAASAAAGHMPRVGSMLSLGVGGGGPQLLLQRAQSHPGPFSQQQQLGLPMLGLDAFGAGMMPPAAAAAAGLDGLANLPLHFVANPCQGHMAAQIAADLASPCSSPGGASSSSHAAAASVGAGPVLAQSGPGSLQGQQQLLQLLEGAAQGAATSALQLPAGWTGLHGPAAAPFTGVGALGDAAAAAAAGAQQQQGHLPNATALGGDVYAAGGIGGAAAAGLSPAMGAAMPAAAALPPYSYAAFVELHGIVVSMSLRIEEQSLQLQSLTEKVQQLQLQQQQPRDGVSQVLG